MNFSELVALIGGIAIFGTAVWFGWKVVHHH